MGLFDFLKSKKQTGRKSNEYALVAESENRGVSFEEARHLQSKFLRVMELDSRSAQFNMASVMMLHGAYEVCIAAYEVLSRKYPDALGDCLGQIGLAHFFKKEYNEALEFYLMARDVGADTEMMDDNIWEVCETIFLQSNDKSAIERYLAVSFSNAQYIKKAKKLLAS